VPTRILCVAGTRPEAIKLAPVLKGMESRPNNFDVRLCVTAQHREMLDSVISFFRLQVHYDLNLMLPDQDLNQLSAGILNGLHDVISHFQPEWMCVQGDTTSTLMGALAAHNSRVKLMHVEAGLRSFNKHSPYPEEMNRVLISRITDLHFAPTERARQNLIDEGVVSNVWLTGNTAIDALNLGLGIRRGQPLEIDGLDQRHPFILVTCHRRENFGAPIRQICQAIATIARRFPSNQILFPVHLNPNIRRPAFDVLGDVPNVVLVGPLGYGDLISALSACYLVLTDSGGLQEEAPSLGKPVLVLRDVTERLEGIEAGTSKLVGTDEDRIVAAVSELLRDDTAYRQMAKASSPYGDGRATEHIIAALLPHL
jgi:UDP-N-acetylglucosamine 2-epimerase (non-hydrolysing)